MNTSVSFTANLIKRTQIPKRCDNDNFEPADISIVELDKNNPDDIKSLYDTTVLWNYQNAKYSSNIYHEAVKGYEYDDVEKEHYFALTEQNENYDKLNPEKILGLMLFSNQNFTDDEINWLQVRPSTSVKQTYKRDYKNVGKSMIDLLKQVNYFKNIHVLSSSEAVGFYKKQGFVNCEGDVPTSLYLMV